MIEVSLLGPPRVEHDGVLVAFDTRKAVALLAHLALSDRPRPREALADLLWPEADPERARGALRRTLSSLRSAIGVESLEATRDHVLLVRGPHITVDVDRFRLLRASGDPQGAVAVFRGNLLEGFAIRDAPDFEDWVRVESEALARELAGALADMASAREAAGDPAGALQAVRRWLALDPLHEPAHRALIRLHARAGDRAAAISQYRECVRTLSRELGVPPLAETTALYEAVNGGSFDPAPGGGGTGEPPPPVAPASFVGRAAELRSLLEVHSAVERDARVAVVEGEPGIGKTRLADELLAAVRERGAHGLVLRAHEGESTLAYAPIVEALRGRVRADRSWLVTADPTAVAQAARLVPELAEEGTAALGSGVAEGPGAEIRFLSGIWDVLVAATAGDAAGVIVVDDLQWADDATLAVLSYGLRRLAGRRALVVLTCRTPLDHPLRGAATEAARTGGGVLCRLQRLGPGDVMELVQAARPGEPDPDLAHRLWERTEGVPLLLVEYLRTLGPDTRDLSAQTELPDGVRAVLRARLDPVSETGRQILSAAAVIGRSFDVDTVRSVSGRTDEETVEALEEVVRRGLVREWPDTYDFGHEELRALVYEDTSLARRRLLHSRAAVVPASSGAVARHLHLAGRDAEAAAAHWRAAEEARTVYANAEALDHLLHAAALGHPQRTAVHLATADLQTVMGDYTAARQSLEAAAAGAEPGEIAAVEHRLGRLQQRRGDWTLAEAHLQAALDATPPEDAVTRAGITADLSLTLHAVHQVVRARDLARDAAALSEQAGDDRARGRAYNLLGMLATAEADTGQALDLLRESCELAERIGDDDLRVAAMNNMALAHRALGELPAAIDRTTSALRLCTALGDLHREAALHNNLADLLHASGRHEEAMTHLKAAVSLFAEIGVEEPPRPEVWKLIRW